jgi:hypothetical protein
MADRDILFAVRNNYYLGAYQNAINEASDLEGLADQEQIELNSFVYRSYIALGSYEVQCRSRSAPPCAPSRGPAADARPAPSIYSW